MSGAQKENDESSSDSEDESSDEENVENKAPAHPARGVKRASAAPFPSESKALKQNNE